MRKNGAIGALEVCRAQPDGFVAAEPPRSRKRNAGCRCSLQLLGAAKQLLATGAGDGELGNKMEALELQLRGCSARVLSKGPKRQEKGFVSRQVLYTLFFVSYLHIKRST